MSEKTLGAPYQPAVWPVPQPETPAEVWEPGTTVTWQSDSPDSDGSDWAATVVAWRPDLGGYVLAGEFGQQWVAHPDEIRRYL